MPASIQVSTLLNQSFDWPRSSISCRLPTASASDAKPKKSNCAARFTVSFMNVSTPRKLRMPKGTLM